MIKKQTNKKSMTENYDHFNFKIGGKIKKYAKIKRSCL